VRDASNRDGAALLSSIIDLAHKLQLRVVAEGVETEEQLIFLQRLGCDHMQGYLFSRPVAGEQFQQMLTGEDFRLNEPNGFIYARAV
jgi:EAL domain-containing protein (putative c-di-GMP-specific phosphodiesterase class I)